METKTRKRLGRLSLYPMKVEDAIKALAKIKPERKRKAIRDRNRP